MEGLAPNDDPLIARSLIETLEGPAVLVGHLPHLSRLCSLLVLGTPGPELVAFPSAAFVALSRRHDGGWRIDWVVTPEIAR
jgi:phosphohistidine phosphatase